MFPLPGLASESLLHCSCVETTPVSSTLTGGQSVQSLLGLVPVVLLSFWNMEWGKSGLALSAVVVVVVVMVRAEPAQDGSLYWLAGQAAAEAGLSWLTERSVSPLHWTGWTNWLLRDTGGTRNTPGPGIQLHLPDWLVTNWWLKQRNHYNTSSRF